MIGEELKPCPFCGAIPDVGVIPETDESPRGYFCKCPNCLAETGASSDRAHATAVWNRRADDADQALPKDGWRPIESAPRDGTWLLVVFPSGFMHTTKRADAVHYTDLPTHWMPLPEPPKDCHQ